MCNQRNLSKKASSAAKTKKGVPYIGFLQCPKLVSYKECLQKTKIPEIGFIGFCKKHFLKDRKLPLPFTNDLTS